MKVSRDGSTIIGNSYNEDSSIGQRLSLDIRRRHAGSRHALGGDISVSSAVSGNGAFVAGTSGSSGGERAFRWTSGSGMENLGTLGGNNSQANAISDDGQIVVGSSITSMADRHAFRWTSGGGMQDLGVLSGSQASATLISRDGKHYCRYSRCYFRRKHSLARWTQGSGMQALGSIGGDASTPLGISADGSTIVGYGDNGNRHNNAFRWTSGGGM